MKKLIFMGMLPFLIFGSPLAAYSGGLYQVVHSPFAANIARNPGDLLTVKVVEGSTTSDTGANSVNRKLDAAEGTLEKFFFPKFNIAKGFSRTILGGTPPGVDANSEFKTTGSASSTSGNLALTELTVRIVSIVSRDQFLVQGHRTINLNGKNTRVFISGVVRERDIASDNTIVSTAIADATVEIIGQSVTEDLRPGLLSRFFGLVL